MGRISLINYACSLMCAHARAHTDTQCTAQSLLCERNEGLGTLHAGNSERPSVAVLADWVDQCGDTLHRPLLGGFSPHWLHL